MSNEKKVEVLSGSQSPSDDGNSQNLKVLFFPFLIFFLALSAFKFFTEASHSENSRAPSSISGADTIDIPEPISVPAALKTLLKVTDADLDRSMTAKIRKELASGTLPQSLQKSSAEIIDKLKTGEMRFYTFKIIESIDDDGDEVEILVDGQSLGNFVLSQSEEKISIPLEFGKTKVLTVRAIRDSGDGVTFGAKLLGSDFLLDNIQVGESDTVYFSYKK